MASFLPNLQLSMMLITFVLCWLRPEAVSERDPKYAPRKVLFNSPLDRRIY